MGKLIKSERRIVCDIFGNDAYFSLHEQDGATFENHFRTKEIILTPVSTTENHPR